MVTGRNSKSRLLRYWIGWSEEVAAACNVLVFREEGLKVFFGGIRSSYRLLAPNYHCLSARSLKVKDWGSPSILIVDN